MSGDCRCEEVKTKATSVAGRICCLFISNKAMFAASTIFVADAIFVIIGLGRHCTWLVSLVAGKYEWTLFGVAQVVLWGLGPPCWFFFESFVLNADAIPGGANFNSNKFERLKLAQDLAKSVWAAILVAILFLGPK